MSERTESSTDARRGQVAADAAEVYEEFFVPALFARWTGEVLRSAAVQPGSTVIDVGCGTGVLARAAASCVGDQGDVVGVDPNPGMLAVAERLDPRVRWFEAVAESLPFDDDRFDHAVSQFAWMFLDDPAAAGSELARVVAPGGCVAVATWASLSETPGYAAMVSLLAEEVGPDAADALRAPYCLGDPDLLSSMLEPALSDVEVRWYEGMAEFESLESWMHTDIRGWTLSEMIDDETFDRLVVAARQRLDPFVAADGSVRFPAPALIASGRVRP